MRKIKFRGWDIKKNKWFYWDLSTSYGNTNILSINDWTDWEFHQVNIRSVCQYTWIKDRNWNPIYEWDILLVKDLEWEYNTKVFWRHWIFKTESLDKDKMHMWMLWYIRTKEIYVIWNIYENKNLLDK